MSKHRWPMLLIGLMCVALVAACGNGASTSSNSTGQPPSGEEPIRIRFATGLVDSHIFWVGAVKPWMDKVTELTNGQVQFDIYTGGELVTLGNELQAIRDGTIDMSTLLLAYTPDVFKMGEITMLPLNTSDVYIAARAWKKLMESDVKFSNGKTFYESQISDNGLVSFPVTTTPPYNLSTTGAEIKSADDIVKLSLRTPSRLTELFTVHIGATSVNIPGNEAVEAINRGTVDGSYHAVPDWQAYGYEKIFKYTITGLNLGHFVQAISISQEKWDSLPQHVQEAMKEAHELTYMGGADAWANSYDEVASLYEQAGGKFVDLKDLDPASQERLNQGVEDVWHEYIEVLENNGQPGKEAAMLWRDLILEEGGEVPQGIMDLK